MKVFNVDLDNSPLMNAMLEFDKALKEKGIPSFDLNVVGGFALIVKGLRQNVDQVTDVDYIGPSLNSELKGIADSIGIKYGIGKGWINNDLMLTGTTLEDIEYATGPLHFSDELSLSVIRLKFLDERDLLRMKLISLDTSLMAIEFGGDFTRMKDFEDLIRIKNHLNYDYIRMEEEAEGYLMSDSVFDAISAYEMNGAEGVLDFVKDMQSVAMKSAVSELLIEDGDFTI